jgi:methyl-accepting chemotaxis protein
MKLKGKITATVGLAFVILSLATGSTLGSLSSLGGRFESFIDKDLAVNQAINNLYAQGLQIELGVRNIIMDPANRTPLGNMEQARKSFEESVTTLGELSSRRAGINDFVGRVKPLQESLTTLRARVVELAKTNQAEAIAVLNKDETPVWRQMRAHILDELKLDQESVKALEAKNVSSTRRELMTGIVLLLIALGASIAISAWLTRSITKPLSDAVNVAKSVAVGDLSHSIDVSRTDELGELMQALREMNDGLLRIVSGVRERSEYIAAATQEIAQGNSDLSSRTESQASALEETAASMEELGSTVTQNADNARQANQLAQNASTVAVQGGDVVGQVVDTMKGINDSSKKIADIISVIDGIAFQTNILALNAAVEAARAGEQGRGFAVVASEVRSLAQRSADAAKEIKTLITDSVERVEQGSALVDRAGSTMEEVVANIRRVTDIMGEISAASAEQSAGVAQVGEAVIQMDQATQQNAALVEESTAAANSLQQQTRELVEMVSVFKTA